MNNNKINKILDLIIYLLIASLLVFTVFSLPGLPDSIPNHHNANGNIKDYMSKYFILFPALIGCGLSIFIKILGKHPSLFNYVVEITPKNKEIQYSMGKTLAKILNICVISIFFTMTYCTVNGLKSYSVFIILAFMSIAIIIYIIMSVKNR